MRCTPLLLGALIPGVFGFELPFGVSRLFSSKTAAQTGNGNKPAATTTSRIAIIGAGAGGSSAAFWIAKAKERFGIDVEVDVYERSDYIGGRTTVVHPYNNKSLPALELGASIFVKAHKHLWRAADDFNLTRRSFNENDYDTGIWNGEQIFLQFGGSWWDTAKLLWRYGLFAPKRTEEIVRGMMSQFLGLYKTSTLKWDSMLDLPPYFGWQEHLNITAREFFKGRGVGERYINEVIQAATRVNYGQNINYINGLGGAVCMAGMGATGIKGGNYLIFAKFLEYSKAKLHLKTTVKSINPTSSGTYNLKSTRGTTEYKAIILAAPYHQSQISLPPGLSSQIPKHPYVNLHVTILTTTSPDLNPAYFGLSKGSKVPKVLLTAREGVDLGNPNTPKPEFTSITYHGLVQENEWSVKIFSDDRLSDEWLDNMFQGQVTWVHRKEWQAYPTLPPQVPLPPVKLDKGIYYVNSFEPYVSFISTMDTETLSARNIVDLLLNDHFDSGICGPTAKTTPPSINEASSAQQPLIERIEASHISNSTTRKSRNVDDEDFVYGFDC
ncbi:Prenylcysteine lyase-domain-containing protein [Crepidotus variabilis]|uniref:Prenylcysteine lyase-domain-containing protein n=1 Tax=Crepidotus variabilis TaxID=179855 RepID=A0A9P6E7R1_9AGAR|nr:Prenylcysteine lyase-domain-containing protein [Crepidotus variabilis]